MSDLLKLHDPTVDTPAVDMELVRSECSERLQEYVRVTADSASEASRDDERDGSM